jgi:hypothetical protein
MAAGVLLLVQGNSAGHTGRAHMVQDRVTLLTLHEACSPLTPRQSTCAEVLNAYAASPSITGIADVPDQIPS